MEREMAKNHRQVTYSQLAIQLPTDSLPPSLPIHSDFEEETHSLIEET